MRITFDKHSPQYQHQPIPTTPTQQPVQTQQQPARMTSVEDLVKALNESKITETIPLFSGNSQQYITSWLTEAESLATVYNWSERHRKTNFASRFRGPALKWHTQRMATHANESYADWKNALKQHFLHPAHKEKKIIKLEKLEQTSNQPIRAFIDKINSIYTVLVYGTSMERQHNLLPNLRH